MAYDILDDFYGGGTGWTAVGLGESFANNRFEYTGKVAGYEYKAVTARTELWLNFKTCLNASTWNDGDLAYGTGALATSTADNQLLHGYYKYSGVNYHLLIYMDSGGTKTSIPLAAVTSQWYEHVIRYKKATADPGTDGIIQWWIDGSLVLNLSNVPNGGLGNLGYYGLFGVLAASIAGTSITFYVDDYYQGQDAPYKQKVIII